MISDKIYQSLIKLYMSNPEGAPSPEEMGIKPEDMGIKPEETETGQEATEDADLQSIRERAAAILTPEDSDYFNKMGYEVIARYLDDTSARLKKGVTSPEGQEKKRQATQLLDECRGKMDRERAGGIEDPNDAQTVAIRERAAAIMGSDPANLKDTRLFVIAGRLTEWQPDNEIDPETAERLRLASELRKEIDVKLAEEEARGAAE
ncbi:MAG: hypothetical protein ABIB97_04470 [Patescibacteria group bacterium]